jgi:redox-sensitive bicupin YhaK (pirin superfamily)
VSDLDRRAQLLAGRDVVLGGTRGMPVRRTLPNAERRMVGAWCFADHFVAADPTLGMHVPPHPHTGLQTVTWLVDGAVRHRDSLGSDQLIRPGQLNLMTAGHGIAHSEHTPGDGALHGVQLWVALPAAARDGAAAFGHHADLPRLEFGAASVTVLLGELGGAASPARAFTPIVGAEAAFTAGGAVELPLRPSFEHAVMSLAGSLDVDGTGLEPGALLYLGGGRTALPVRAEPGARLLLLGGEPFEERIVMWWNFIGRSHDDILAMREQWMAGDTRFGRVADGEPLPAPVLPTTTLLPRGRVR